MDRAADRLEPLLAQLVNYERTRPDRRLWDLATTRALLARAGAQAPPRPAVQVGGSKGKGTTCAFLEALALAAGRRVGVYTSPHVETLLERIRWNGENIGAGELEALLRGIVGAGTGDRAPTFFEAMTVAAAEHFAARGAQLAVYEVGLGGRHDATTALPVDASIVTTIEREHTDVLGDTIAAIADEKAQIVREGGVAFTATSGEALDVIRARARAADARLFVFGEDFGVRERRWDGEGVHARLWLPGGRELAVFLPEAAGFEVPALALALAAFTHVLPGAPLQLDPAPRPHLPCRFEVLRDGDGEVLVLDGAHTEQSLQAVAAEMHRRWPGHRASVLFGVATGKQWREGLSALRAVADRFVVTGLSGTSSEDPAVLAAFLAANGAECESAADVESGLSALRRRPGPRLVAGSFYLAGAVRRLVRAGGRPPPR
jgi:dihydrofolate synthase/folylpolyglutamate synthase